MLFLSILLLRFVLSLNLLLFLLVFRNIPYVSLAFFVYFADYNTSFKV